MANAYTFGGGYKWVHAHKNNNGVNSDMTDLINGRNNFVLLDIKRVRVCFRYDESNDYNFLPDNELRSPQLILMNVKNVFMHK